MTRDDYPDVGRVQQRVVQPAVVNARNAEQRRHAGLAHPGHQGLTTRQLRHRRTAPASAIRALRQRSPPA